RPVLFAQMSSAWGLSWSPLPADAGTGHGWQHLPVAWAPLAAEKAVLILDLPAAEAVHVGLALAGRGYRPVPLYNGCTGPSEILDQGPILRALRDGAAYLALSP